MKGITRDQLDFISCLAWGVTYMSGGQSFGDTVELLDRVLTGRSGHLAGSQPGVVHVTLWPSPLTHVVQV